MQLSKDDIQAHRDRLARNFAELTKRLHSVEGAVQFADVLLKQIAEGEEAEAPPPVLEDAEAT